MVEVLTHICVVVLLFLSMLGLSRLSIVIRMEVGEVDDDDDCISCRGRGGGGKRRRGEEGGIRRRAYEKRESQPPYTPPYSLAVPLPLYKLATLPTHARTIRRNLQLAPFVGKL